MDQIQKLIKQDPHHLRSYLDELVHENKDGLLEQIREWIPEAESTVFLPLLEWITDQGIIAEEFIGIILDRIKKEKEQHQIKGMLTYFSYIGSYQAIQALAQSASHFNWHLQTFIQKTIERMKNRCIDFLLVQDLKENLGQPLKVKKIVDSMKNNPSPLYESFLLQLANENLDDSLDAALFLAQAFKSESALKALLKILGNYVVASRKFFEFYEILQGSIEPPSDVFLVQLIEMERVDDLMLRLKSYHKIPSHLVQSFKVAYLLRVKGEPVPEPIEKQRPPSEALEIGRTIGLIAKQIGEDDILEIVGEQLFFHPWSKHICLALLAGNQVSEGKDLLLQWFDEAEDEATRISVLKVLKNYHLNVIPANLLDLFHNPNKNIEDDLNTLVANSRQYNLVIEKIQNLSETKAIRVLRQISQVKPIGEVEVDQLFMRPNASVQYLEAAIDLMVNWRPQNMEKVAGSFINPSTSYAVRFDALNALMRSGPLWWKKLQEILDKSDAKFKEETLSSALSMIEKNPKLTFDNGVQIRPWLLFLNAKFERIVAKATEILVTMDGGDFFKVDEWISEINRQLKDNPYPVIQKLTRLRSILKQNTNPDLPKSWEEFDHDYALFNDFNKSRWIRLLSQIEVPWFQDSEVKKDGINWLKAELEYFRNGPNVLKDLVKIAKILGPENLKDELLSLTKSKFKRVQNVALAALEDPDAENNIKKIIIVDDSLVIGKRLKTFLNGMGFQADYITEPERLADVNTDDVDLFVMDYFLGTTTGSVQALELIARGFQGEFIFITSGRNPEIKMAINSLPKQWPILYKPFPLNKLVDLISEFKACPAN